MIRKSNQKGLLRWKKITGGVHVLADKTQVKKGDIFLAKAEDIPKSFASSFECLDIIPEKTDPGMKLTVKAAGGNKWNIVNTITGEVINEKPLSAKDAKTFLEEGEKLPKEDMEPVKIKTPLSKKLDEEEEEEDEFDEE